MSLFFYAIHLLHLFNLLLRKAPKIGTLEKVER